MATESGKKFLGEIGRPFTRAPLGAPVSLNPLSMNRTNNMHAKNQHVVQRLGGKTVTLTAKEQDTLDEVLRVCWDYWEHLEHKGHEGAHEAYYPRLVDLAGPEEAYWLEEIVVTLHWFAFPAPARAPYRLLQLIKDIYLTVTTLAKAAGK